MKMLFSHPQPYVDIRDPDNWTALWHAVYQDDEELVQLLLNSGLDIKATDIEALHDAAKQGHLAVVKLLLAKASIDINAKDRNNTTRGNDNHVAARLLAEPNIDINAVGQFKQPLPDRSTSLHHAV
ncbi:hypothetical protein CNMCM5623_004810 [Aspergillus felis]|uniref:Ankyrin repeat protein n=1 Tax=Aspergillus felis TaxID=1287682 RepID=A0A8H6PSD6_9EURO|nr:hypothetical protein CNMCM5623_004810 [Aspergillus felis]